MRVSRICGVAMLLSAALLVSSCAKNESPVDKAVESTKDALNIREHEKLKDAGEDMQDAMSEAAEDVKDAVNGE